jgi:phage FluMu gp28-like protein
MNIKLYTPHAKQKEIHDSCSDKAPNFFTVAIAGRQSGKSMCAINQALMWALTTPNALIWYVTPFENQAMKVYRDIYLASSKIIKNKKSSKGGIEITFINGSRIEFKCSSSEGSLRGNSVQYMIIDEVAFMKEATINEIILPTLAFKGKKCLMISTPKGKNWLYNWFLRGQTEGTNVKSFKFTTYDNDKQPESGKLLVETLKATIPAEIFSQEFLAEWVDSSSVFRHIDELATETSVFKASEKVNFYIGIDIGLLKDFTVVTVLNSKGHMVYYDRFTGIETNEIVKRISKIQQVFNARNIIIEENNQGLPILQELRRAGLQVTGFYTTNESKSEIVNNLIAAFSSKEIRVVTDDVVKEELKAFVFNFSPTGKIRYEASSGFHDDIVMSLALAWHSFVKYKRTSGYSSLVSSRKLESLKEPYRRNTKGYDDVMDEYNLS